MISCLLPTYNRCPALIHLLEEAIASFVFQDPCPPHTYELLICNDTPGQTIKIRHPRIKIFNLDERLPSLSDKLIFLINQAQGDYLTRWDDDDISLPHRLKLSIERLGDSLEWHPKNHWYREAQSNLRMTINPGNVANMSLWRRGVLDIIGGFPPKRYGDEDQKFTSLVKQHNLSISDLLAPADIFYIYRWATGSSHLSGRSDLEAHYKEIGTRPIETGGFHLTPHWRESYISLADYATRVATP